MHEAGLVEDLLRQVTEICRRQRASRVMTVRVVLGEFSGVQPELFRSAYNLLAPDTVSGPARLELKVLPLRGSCDHCGQTFPIRNFCFACTGCGSSSVQVVQGEELLLEEVTLEIDEV